MAERFKAEMRYKAFISYSHAADKKLAPALQLALHRFAKPLLKLRAMRVFRDETNLSNTPHLWAAIESQLNQSEYFVLLASPEAANSKWVKKEVTCWLSTRPPDTMLLVLTEGTIAWDPDGNDFDWEQTSALPSVLSGRYSEEPLYTDLRWARTTNDLSLSNPRFKSAVADVAATLLGRSKDDLVGTDVEQHRRVRRLVTGTILVLTALTTVSATTAAVLYWLYSNDLTPSHLSGRVRALFTDYQLEPRLVRIGPGCFFMGTEDAEAEERPVHEVCIQHSYAIASAEVSFDEFSRFAYATGRRLPETDWNAASQPVINVSWADARDYTSWLRERTGKPYRLPSEAEWEFAARAGTVGFRFWGDDPRLACRYANVSDLTAADAQADVDRASGLHDCRDGYAYTAPVMGRKPNDWGLYDMMGNVWEWVQDCYHASYRGAPSDGRPWEESHCELRVLRGGAWNYGPAGVHSANRVGNRPSLRINTLGFRVASD